jgi:hypothetical protein
VKTIKQSAEDYALRDIPNIGPEDVRVYMLGGPRQKDAAAFTEIANQIADALFVHIRNAAFMRNDEWIIELRAIMDIFQELKAAE